MTEEKGNKGEKVKDRYGQIKTTSSLYNSNPVYKTEYLIIH